MDDSARDFYDIPTRWIPSSNFANRPTSEISEINLDRLWTLMSSSDSPVSSSEVEDTPTPTSREAPAWKRESDLAITASQPRLGRLSDDVEALDRPIGREKATTAPAGGFSTPGYAPRPLRRAVSVSMGTSSTIRGISPWRRDHEIDPLTVERVPTAERVGLHKRLPSTPRSTASTDSSLWSDAKLAGSFSQRTRVRKTLDNKNVRMLNTEIVDFESRGLLSSPRSIMNTPQELYAISEKRATGEEPSSPSSPHAKDARKSILSSLSGKGSTLHLNKLSLRQQHDCTLKTKTPREWGSIYLPGTICLEKHPAQLRKDSVASLDPFAKEVEPRVRRHSDLIVLDSITAFFADFGVTEDATEVCLDMFWRDAFCAPHQVADTRRSSIISVEEPLLVSQESIQSPPNVQSLHGSRFSFSSASSSTSLPRNGTPMRQRDKLRRLLSPAFPVSAFLKNPGAPKEQDSNSDVSSVSYGISTFSASSAQRRDK
jgi:hypothetical protein